MSWEAHFDRIHHRIQSLATAQYLAAFTRLLLAVGFVAPGMHKVVGHPFTTPGAFPPDHPLQLFFDAFFSSGELYAFVGLIQAAAGLLLLFHRTAPLGAMLYLPVIAGIFFVTVGLPFGATRYIAGAMLLASALLFFWYYPSWKRVIFPIREPVPTWRSPKALSIACGSWYALAASGIALTLTMRSVIPMHPFLAVSWVLFGLAMLLGIIGCVANIRVLHRRVA